MRATKGWRVSSEIVRADHVHVHPVGDLTEHDIDGDDCVCGPTTEYVPAETVDQSSGWLLTHHALDGREALE